MSEIAATPPPIPVVIDNPGDWASIMEELGSRTGSPPTITPELVAGVVGSAAPLLFAADAAGTSDRLRGTFPDPVIAQVERNFGSFFGERPVSGTVHLVGSPAGPVPPALRIHLQLLVKSAQGDDGVNSQFWDLAVGSQVTVGDATCPNCGAPLAVGQLICDHCHTDARSIVSVPLAVSRLVLY